ncbi:helix-turn-helix domain-containing protein [Bailinhaonella thermotolerans]|uniref:XRE family transcriptional regulator n=1 Tax=Bailinhaonella thermotolerans TaxID=1070861 RepID=A0A3A4ABT9_9ACTN|nr:helix-turn-helix transcriptional regulator [Bailinhaonella thermotolerans]RJL23964.1 XRE family transcriptional regulator [Bailinhaonella thermotolerans]
MPTSPSSSAQVARQQLGDQLRNMRRDARLTGREFARQAGWADATNVTKVEKAQRTITPDHVRLWCRICGQPPEREAELLAEQESVSQMWQTYAQLAKSAGGGLKARQERLRDRYWRVKRQRTYQTKVIPGLLQTEAMMTFYLTQARVEQHLERDDVAEAVIARMDRQGALNRLDALWGFILEEDVLWYRPGPADVHREQLRYLINMIDSGRQNIFLGVIPRDIDRHGVIPGEAFIMDDDTLVTVELISGYLRLTRPDEIRMYGEAWDRLLSIAVHGRQARYLMERALGALG